MFVCIYPPMTHVAFDLGLLCVWKFAQGDFIQHLQQLRSHVRPSEIFPRPSCSLSDERGYLTLSQSIIFAQERWRERKFEYVKNWVMDINHECRFASSFVPRNELGSVIFCGMVHGLIFGHYTDITMSVMASQISSNSTVYSTICSS